MGESMERGILFVPTLRSSRLGGWDAVVEWLTWVCAISVHSRGGRKGRGERAKVRENPRSTDTPTGEQRERGREGEGGTGNNSPQAADGGGVPEARLTQPSLGS
jgi:hypothetical protein